MDINSVLLRRGKILIARGHGQLGPSVLATFNLNLQSLGYTLALETLAAIKTLSLQDATDLFESMTAVLKELKGVKTYTPMYPNFPTQVFEASNAELYLNAILHYFTAWVSDITNAGPAFIWLPKYKKNVRDPLDEKVELTVIRLATENDVSKLATALVTSNTSLSETDKDALKFLIKEDYLTAPPIIPNKENLAVFGSVIASNGKLSEKYDISPYYKTATDVLRLAVGMSNGDVSLAETTKFRNFTRRERRLLLNLLEKCGDTRTEDMNRWRGRWLRLGEKLHPGDFAQRYPSALGSFLAVWSELPIVTFNSSVEKSVRSANTVESIRLLSKRPGEFARRLDHILRLANPWEVGDVLSGFGVSAAQVSTPVLLQVAAHFKHRSQSNLRVIFPKGNTAKVRALENELPPVSGVICSSLVNLCNEALTARFSKMPPLGKVYLDPNLKNYLVPFSQRSASAGTRTLVRGSKIPFSSEKDTIRFFIWWKDIQGEKGGSEDEDSYHYSNRVDLDLSALMYSADWTMMEQISYTNLRSARYHAAHSGDITAAPNGACEFIDIDIPSILNYGGRYVIMNVRSFTSQPFNTIPECSAGWMMRENPKSGEIFDARTVQDKINLTVDSKVSMPLIIDLVERQIIWVDAAMKANCGWVNNIHGNSDTIALMGRAFTQIMKPTLYDLLSLHAGARGVLVSSEDKADVAFTSAETPFELERISSEFMPDLKRIQEQPMLVTN